MKRVWMVVIMAGAVLSSGCATAMGGAFPGRGAASGRGHATTFQKGPVYTIGGGNHHSLAGTVAARPSPTSPLGVAPRAPILIGPDDSPLAEWSIFGVGVSGLSGTDIRRSGLRNYLRNWAELGLGRTIADISRDPSTIYTYLQFKVFRGPDGARLVLH